MRVLWRSVIVVVIASVLGEAAVANAQYMSLVPKATFGGYPQPFFDACNHMDQWSTVKSVTGYLGSFLSDLYAADDATLATCLANLQSAGLYLSIEAPAFQPPPTVGGCGTGAQCYDVLAPLLDRLIGLGSPGIRIRMQEPLTVARYAGWDQNDTVNQTVTFVQLIRSHYSGVQVTSVEAYPYNSAALLNWWMAAVTNTSASIGIQPPDYFEVDHDWNAPGWSQADMAAMRDQAHSLGWGYVFIFGSPLVGSYSWHDSTLLRGWLLWSAGIIPDLYTFESWEQTDPGQTIPETSSPTFMGTVRDFRSAGYFPR